MQTPKNKNKCIPKNIYNTDSEYVYSSKSPTTSPKHSSDTDDEVVIQYTQEVDDDVDVIWDWNSPSLKQTYVRKRKKLDVSISPKITIKKYPSNGRVPTFDKLKEEVAALRSQIIKPTREASGSSSNAKEKDYFQELLKDDSIDEELVLCSQMVEKDFKVESHKSATNVSNLDKSDDDRLEKPTKNIFENSTFNMSDVMNDSIKKICTDEMADDSFDFMLGQVEDDKLDQAARITESQTCFTFSQPKPAESESYQGSLRKSKSLDNAIRKAKKDETSPIKCSPKEIEQKRLQAIAKLQAKKKQEIIERNRREAIKRLEMSKKRRVLRHNQFP